MPTTMITRELHNAKKILALRKERQSLRVLGDLYFHILHALGLIQWLR